MRRRAGGSCRIAKESESQLFSWVLRNSHLNENMRELETKPDETLTASLMWNRKYISCSHQACHPCHPCNQHITTHTPQHVSLGKIGVSLIRYSVSRGTVERTIKLWKQTRKIIGVRTAINDTQARTIDTHYNDM